MVVAVQLGKKIVEATQLAQPATCTDRVCGELALAVALPAQTGLNWGSAFLDQPVLATFWLPLGQVVTACCSESQGELCPLGLDFGCFRPAFLAGGPPSCVRGQRAPRLHELGVGLGG